jgi:hypothetical protein
MGGRMSGESPREEKVEVRAGKARAERAYQANVGGETATPILVRQRSRQQLNACGPFGQHVLGETSECEIVALWQSVDIKGEVAANAAMDPCTPRANIKMTEMRRRFMRTKITPFARLRNSAVASTQIDYAQYRDCRLCLSHVVLTRWGVAQVQRFCRSVRIRDCC